MEKVRYMISDAATMAGVESHVLRYWEDELDLSIPRNEMGHRYYTRENIQEFQRIKELKEQGYQLKAIRMILHNGGTIPTNMSPDGVIQTASASNTIPERPATSPAISIIPKPVDMPKTAPPLSAEERMAQFRELMSGIVGQAIAQNNEELSLNISQEVKETVLKEMNYLFREQEEAQEDRYKKLDAAIRGHVKKKRSLFAPKDKPVKEKAQKTAKAQYN